MAWGVVWSREAANWLDGLDDEDYQRVRARVELLQERGPALGRPAVDTITGSRHPNLKELRCGTIRVLFAFDPHRQAVMLFGDDKRDDWSGFYRDAIPLADAMFDEHIRAAEGRA